MAMRDLRCDGCGDRFRCRVDDAQPCWCASVDVPDEARVTLAALSSDCLCPACLAEVSVIDVDEPATSDVDA
jgi:hypothetical protein